MAKALTEKYHSLNTEYENLVHQANTEFGSLNNKLNSKRRPRVRRDTY